MLTSEQLLSMSPEELSSLATSASGNIESLTFDTNPLLAGLAQQYQPPTLIVDKVIGPVKIPNAVEGIMRLPVLGNDGQYDYGNLRRAMGGLPKQFQMEDVSNRSVEMFENALMVKIDKRQNNAGGMNSFDYQKYVNEALVFAMLLNRELVGAAFLQDSDNFGDTEALGGTDKWSDNTSDPIDDIITEMDAIEDLTHVRPNRITMDRDTWRAVGKNTNVTGLLTNTTESLPKILSPEKFIEILVSKDPLSKGTQLHIGKGTYKTKDLVSGVETSTDIWTKMCALTYVPDSQIITSASLQFAGLFQKSSAPIIKTTAPDSGGNIAIAGETVYGIAQVSKYTGFLFTTTIA